ncbi:MAG TPA: ABC transporter substrate-binding protein, partial [Streptosporangiaceae bacterium]|nr:ABC transporter substrate-binding protein [Streptosporangiaceae bacterium]
AAITSTDSSGQDGWENIQKAVAGSGGAVTINSHQQFDPTAVSVTTQLSKIKASKPQAVMIWTTGTPLGTVLKGMQQLGMGSLPTMTTNGNASTAELQRLSGELPSQLFFPGAPFEVGAGGLTGQEKNSVQAFYTAMRAAGEKVPSEGNALPWDPALMLVNALKKLGTGASAAQLHTYVSSLTSFGGINGSYNFASASNADNRGLSLSSVYVVKWDQSAGHWVKASGPAGNGTS